MDYNILDYVDIDNTLAKPFVTIDPHVIYPATIKRIRYVLDNGITPHELKQIRVDAEGFETENIERMKVLVRNARLLPAEAWDNALRPRWEFPDYLGYSAPKARPPIDLFAPGHQNDIQRLWDRGDALEVAMGWFLQALRCRIGGSNIKILSGLAEGSIQKFKPYQL